MDLKTLRVYGKGGNSHYTCNVIISFECVELDDPSASSYCVIHRVQLEPTVDSTLLIDVPLDCSDVRSHFESLLSSNFHGYDTSTEVAI